jgi:asparaginyl-tRNA synthetase
MKTFDLKAVLARPEAFLDTQLIVQGWIRQHRKQKQIGFIEFFDGTVLSGIQIVYTAENPAFEAIQALRVGSAITVEGRFQKSGGAGQSFEIAAENITLEGDCDEDYPIQPKRHTPEFLREVGYLRPRAKLFQAAFRVRSVTSAAIHNYFQERGYVYLHSPLITANDGEGAGETFQVTTLPPEKIAKGEYADDFFGCKVCLAVTGQLEAETFALAFKRAYTFGPTFRAENSNTKTHASEFWMIEPEIAFCDLTGLMDIEEECLKYIVSYVLKHAADEIAFFNQFVSKGLTEKLTALTSSTVARVSHKDAMDILINSGAKFDNKPVQGGDFAKEHEKYLTDVHFKSPVFVYDWPKDIKAFYMKQNPDGETVAAVDLLVPTAGELMGGSQREENHGKLITRMNELNMNIEELRWYVNLRRFGGCKHAGFGMGLERLLIYLTGIENIRDVLPFPRTPGNCEF